MTKEELDINIKQELENIFIKYTLEEVQKLNDIKERTNNILLKVLNNDNIGNLILLKVDDSINSIIERIKQVRRIKQSSNIKNINLYIEKREIKRNEINENLINKDEIYENNMKFIDGIVLEFEELNDTIDEEQDSNILEVIHDLLEKRILTIFRTNSELTEESKQNILDIINEQIKADIIKTYNDTTINLNENIILSINNLVRDYIEI